MIYIRDEGEPVKNGFNFYPANSTNSRGAVARLGKLAIWLRYSLRRKRVFFSFQKQQEMDFNA